MLNKEYFYKAFVENVVNGKEVGVACLTRRFKSLETAENAAKESLLNEDGRYVIRRYVEGNNIISNDDQDTGEVVMKYNYKKLVDHCLCIFDEANGSLAKTVTGLGTAMHKLYVMQNGLKESQDAILFNMQTGEVVTYFEGNEDDFPTVTEGKDLEYHHIDQYSPGLLEMSQSW